MRRAIFFCAVVGALVGFAEAACAQKLSKLYFTPGAKVGLSVIAALLYAVYGAAAGGILFPLWRRFFRGAPERAMLASSVLAWCLVYGLGYLVVCRLIHREVPRFLLWGACVVLVSLLLSAFIGWAFGSVIIRGRRSLVLVVIIVAGITAWLLVPGHRRGTPHEELPDIVLVTLDTVRADRLHSYGNERVRTPSLDRIASEGVLFENAISQIPITNPSHLSILSSTYPHQHGVIENWYRHSSSIPKIVHELKEHGYETAAFVSSFVLDSRFGFADGFDVYDDDFSRLKGYQSLTLVRVVDALLGITGGRLERVAGRTNRDAISWLLRRARSPFFLWVHYYDPHGPYAPPAPYFGMYYGGKKDDMDNRSMDGVAMPVYWPPSARDFTDIAYPIAQYDAEVTYTDAELGRLVDELDEKIGDYVLVVVSDHGESLTEHGYYFRHGDYLYDDQIKVPMIIRGGKGVEPRRVGTVVETIDIAPTVLELAGLGVPSWCAGESLVPLMEGEEVAPGEGLSETRREGDESILDVAYSDGRYKLIVRPGEGTQLFDLHEDPGELRDLSGEREDLVRTLSERIASMMGGQTGHGEPLLDAETRERLRALGYIR